MTSTVASLFEAAGLKSAGAIAWGAPVPERAPGVYAIALNDGPRSKAPLDLRKIAAWMKVASRLELDGQPVRDINLVADRLNRFWHDNETVLYVGLAGTSLQNRTRQFCRHIVGHNKPHAGGFWLKLLDDDALSHAKVHWAQTSTSDLAEYSMPTAYERGRESITSSPAAVANAPRLPFANIKIEVPVSAESPWGAVRRRLKNHGFSQHTVEPGALPD